MARCFSCHQDSCGYRAKCDCSCHSEEVEVKKVDAKVIKKVDAKKNKNAELTLTGDKDFDEILNKCISILSVKGKDYTIGNDDKLHNFKTAGEFNELSQMQVLGVYFYKHVSAIFAYIKANGQTESEPIEGRIADVINYMLLFYKMVNTQKK